MSLIIMFKINLGLNNTISNDYITF